MYGCSVAEGVDHWTRQGRKNRKQTTEKKSLFFFLLLLLLRLISSDGNGQAWKMAGKHKAALSRAVAIETWDALETKIIQTQTEVRAKCFCA